MKILGVILLVVVAAVALFVTVRAMVRSHAAADDAENAITQPYSK